VRRAQARWGTRALAMSAVGMVTGVGALATVNRLIAMSAGELYSVLGGEEGRYSWEAGSIFYTAQGRGAPLLLLHGVYAGASSFEYRHVFEALARDYRVYALDLLGFGLSARPPALYDPALYVRLIEDFTREVMGGADHPVSVVASGRSAAFAIAAVADRRSLFESLVLVEPMGLEAHTATRVTPPLRLTRGLLRLPMVGEGLYNVVASRASIRRFLARQSAASGETLTDSLIEYHYLAAHQPGARYALASLLSGALDTSVASAYSDLQQPILLVWGKESRQSPLENARAFHQANPRADIRVLPAGALPQEETPEEFVRAVGAWLRTVVSARRPG
jgi:pimeloyl-ACP methyl ester carboxylesterase